MADVFISYRNTPERRALVRRLAAILRAHEVTVWWDYGLEAGESYRAQITNELAKARVVAPLWCAESVNSKWVRMEAELGKDKLVPARLQKVAPPDAFEAIHAADLIGWDGAVHDTRVLEFARRIRERLGHVAIAPTDMIEELAHLPAVPPLPEIAPVTVGPASVAGPMHDLSFWERQWEKFGTSDNLIALRDVADEAPRIFANQARARIAGIEAMQQRQAEERERQERERATAEQRAFRDDGRIKADAEIFHDEAAPAGKLSAIPSPNDLPEHIHDLAHHQEHGAVHEQFGRDEGAHISVDGSGGGNSKTWLWLVGAAGLATAVVVGGYQLWVRDVQLPQEIPAAAAVTTAQVEKATQEETAKRQAAVASLKAEEDPARRDPATSVVPGSGQSSRDCANICPEMVIAPAGTFTMGSTEHESEGPPHRVTISKPFAVGRYAITFEEWDACVADGGCNGYKPEDGGWGRGKRPVINVSWEDAKAYTSWLSRKAGKTYRLLSEAEREYVTRAGTTTPFWWGSSISTSQANYNGNYTDGSSPKGGYRGKTVPVDSFQPNPWGLYQVHGNVWEWCEDNWHANYQGAPVDGSVWSAGDSSLRVLRGGSWVSGPQNLRSANRIGDRPGDRDHGIGFRVARTL